jgi:hypothetical protein
MSSVVCCAVATAMSTDSGMNVFIVMRRNDGVAVRCDKVMMIQGIKRAVPPGYNTVASFMRYK